MGSFGRMCLLSSCVSATEINKTHSVSLTFNHVFSDSPAPHRPTTTDWLQAWIKKFNQASGANALWAECPRAKPAHPVHGAVMSGRWCLWSKSACLILHSNFSCQRSSTHWSHFGCLNLWCCIWVKHLTKKGYIPTTDVVDSSHNRICCVWGLIWGNPLEHSLWN